MRLRVSIWILFALVCGRDLTAGPVPAEVKQAVAFIFVEHPTEKGRLVPNGTGFFTAVRVQPQVSPGQSVAPTAGRLAVYLATAKHVLVRDASSGSLFDQVYVRLNRRDGKTSEMLRLPLITSGTSQNVFVHSDPTVDIAVVPALPNEQSIDFKVITDDMMVTEKDFTELKIAEGSEIFFSGLFVPFIGEQRNNPVVRFGRVAMVPTEPVQWGGQTMELYLMESASYGGNSGSPVFFYLGADREPGSIIVGPPLLKLAGILMGTFLDQQPIRVIENAPRPFSVASMGIAAVVPAFKLP
jgi:hypothetical protein